MLLLSTNGHILFIKKKDDLITGCSLAILIGTNHAIYSIHASAGSTSAIQSMGSVFES